MSVTRLAIHGAAGRMGLRLIALAHASEQFEVVAAIESGDSARLGEDAGVAAGVGEIGVPYTDRIADPSMVDAIIDFSIPQAAIAIAGQAAEAGLPIVLATTGFDTPQEALIRAAAQRVPMVWAPNLSLAVNLVMKLAADAAKALARHPGQVDVEIIEHHHRYKEDAPSGTALRFGELIATAMGLSEHRHGRQGRPGPRPPGEIGYHAVRAGDHPGRHTILFGMDGEMIELGVSATNRDAYAQGALAAAAWLVGKQPGSYSIADVLGLDD